MDFGKVLKTVSEFLSERRYQYGVVGGIALAAYGLPRMTVDLDFVVELRAQEELIRFAESLGYRTLHRSSGYSNHQHPDNLIWGHLDFIYVHGETSQEIFAGCCRFLGPGGLEMPVPKAEHLVAMKVLAMKNNPDRTFQEMADIRFLLTLPEVDATRVEGYFERHGMGKRFDDIKKTL